MTITPLRPLDEQDLRRWRACVRRQWLHGQAPAEPAPSPPSEAVPAEAALALRSAFAGARVIAPPTDEAGWARAQADTLACLADAQLRRDPGATVLGACFTSDDGARAVVDVMQRGEAGWRLFKLRVATVADEADVDALALWTHVVARAGWRVQSAGLLLIDTDFLYPGLGCYAGLFREVDAGPMLGSRPVADWLVALRQGERGPEPPMPLLAPCTLEGGCAWTARCHAGEPATAAVDPRASLEIVGRDLAEQLRMQGHRSLHDVPLQALLDERHRRAWRAVRQGAPVTEPEVAAQVRAWPAPWRLLRLETIGMAVPVWANTRPYEVVPFQWTLATVQPDGTLAIAHWLAEGAADPRRALAESLLQALAGTGTLLAYNAGFERNRLRELARRFEDLAEALDSTAERIVDVFQLARRHFYHPEQAGSWSAKAMYRAVAPELGAHRFEAEGCRTPLQAFGHAMRPGTSPGRRERLRAALVAHGERQVQGLHRLIATFEQADRPPA